MTLNKFFLFLGLADILGPGANFSKTIFVMKPWAQAGCLVYNELYKNNILSYSFFLQTASF